MEKELLTDLAKEIIRIESMGTGAIVGKVVTAIGLTVAAIISGKGAYNGITNRIAAGK